MNTEMTYLARPPADTLPPVAKASELRDHPNCTAQLSRPQRFSTDFGRQVVTKGPWGGPFRGLSVRMKKSDLEKIDP
jgi:hypothetical protein